jgi:tetratricopeptide (TPR) repeat protein
MSDNFEEPFGRGYQARREGRYADSRAIFLDAVRKAAEHADRPHLAEAFCGLAQAERDIGNLEAARHHYANAVLLYQQMGPPRQLAYALRHEADVLREMSLFADAEPLYVEAEGIYRMGGDESLLDLANTLRGLALTREATGEATGTQDASRPLWLEARELYARYNVEAGIAQCDQHLSA